MPARIQFTRAPSPLEPNDRLGPVALMAGACAVGLVALLIAAAATRSCSPARAAELPHQVNLGAPRFPADPSTRGPDSYTRSRASSAQSEEEARP